MLQHLDGTLIETEVLDRLGDLTVLHQEGAVAGQACHQQLPAVDVADVPEARDENCPFRAGETKNFFDRRRVMSAKANCRISNLSSTNIYGRLKEVFSTLD